MSKLTQLISGVCRKFIRYEDLKQENVLLKDKLLSLEQKPVFGWPEGHFYSPIHKLEDLDCYDNVVKRSKGKFSESIPGFSQKEILKHFNSIKNHFKDFDYPLEEDGKSRFYIRNCSYPITDALVLFGMIRHLKPKIIIEIGSGFTSALMMDVNERFLENKTEITFMEPYPETLISRMRVSDKEKYKIIAEKVQDIPLDEFKRLKSGDVLFIDSTHVSKFNSDVNYELFDILPILKPGVIIHFHDVFDGFEYPLVWLNDGWAWNENYLLRAYLTNNENYKVLLMNDYMVNRYGDMLEKSYPRVPNNCGGSFWIKKIK
jgi:predicted O-methyltransferase YrrM